MLAALRRAGTASSPDEPPSDAAFSFLIRPVPGLEIKILPKDAGLSVWAPQLSILTTLDVELRGPAEALDALGNATRRTILSPMAPVWELDARQPLGVPSAAAFFAFAYPLRLTRAVRASDPHACRSRPILPGA